MPGGQRGGGLDIMPGRQRGGGLEIRVVGQRTSSAGRMALTPRLRYKMWLFFHIGFLYGAVGVNMHLCSERNVALATHSQTG